MLPEDHFVANGPEVKVSTDCQGDDMVPLLNQLILYMKSPIH